MTLGQAQTAGAVTVAIELDRPGRALEVGAQC
jgi:hypothetical protein